MKTERVGAFSSSSAWRLMANNRKGDGFGSSGISYIEEKKYERKLGRAISIEKNPRSSSWGKFIEKRVFSVLLDTSYIPTMEKRFAHPIIEGWNGSPDFLRHNEIGDIKSFELLNFCRTHDAATSGYDNFKEECPEIFWQLTSNCCIHNVSTARLILYVPYLSELSAIREEAEIADHKFQWIKFASDDELPYLLPNKYYKNLSTFLFTIKKEDIDILTNRIILAVSFLNKV